MIKIPNGGKAIVEHLLASEEINPKEQDYENHSLDLSRKINQLSKVIWDRKIIKVHQVDQFH